MGQKHAGHLTQGRWRRTGLALAEQAMRGASVYDGHPADEGLSLTQRREVADTVVAVTLLARDPDAEYLRGALRDVVPHSANVAIRGVWRESRKTGL